MTKSFLVGMAVLGSTFNRALDEQAVDGYWMALGDLTEPQLQDAIKTALRQCKFMPAPAELRELAGIDGPKVLAAACADAWEAVRFARRQYSYTVGVDLGPLVNAILRNLGGWIAFCGKDDDAMVWERKEFEKLFVAFSAKGRGSLNGAPLPGQFPGTERIPIAGKMPAVQLAAVPSEVGGVVHRLATAKALPRAEMAPGATQADVGEAMALARAERTAERKRAREAHDATAAAKIAELAARVGG